MNSFRLRPHSFLADVSASTATAWQKLDYQFVGDQKRIIAGTKDAESAIALECMVSANGTDVIVTATVWASVVTGNFAAVLQGPYQAVRVRKIGTSGVATVNGII